MIPSIWTLPKNSGVHQVQFCLKLPLPSAAKCLFHLDILQESNGFHPPALICHRWHGAVEGHDVRPGVPKSAWNHEEIGRRLVVLWFQFSKKNTHGIILNETWTWSRWWFLGPLTFKQLGSTDVPWLGDGIVLDLRFRGVKTHQVSRQGIHSASMDSPSRANEFKIVQVSMINEISIEISHTSHLPHPPQRIPTCHCSHHVAPVRFKSHVVQHQCGLLPGCTKCQGGAKHDVIGLDGP